MGRVEGVAQVWWRGIEWGIDGGLPASRHIASFLRPSTCAQYQHCCMARHGWCCCLLSKQAHAFHHRPNKKKQNPFDAPKPLDGVEGALANIPGNMVYVVASLLVGAGAAAGFAVGAQAPGEFRIAWCRDGDGLRGLHGYACEEGGRCVPSIFDLTSAVVR